MQFYFAPLEGITTYSYRKIFSKYYSGVDKYFAPFITSYPLGGRDLRNLLPENNEGINLVPQILTSSAETFLQLTARLSELGYTEVNLNLGCPSGTVVAKGRGAGFFRDLKGLEQFLDTIYSKSELPISIKTRIGMDFDSEWEDILKIYEKYDIYELTIHPRLGKIGYKGNPDMEAFREALKRPYYEGKLCYNGNIDSVSSYERFVQDFPEIDRIMIGRGLLANPELIEHINNRNADGEISKDRAVPISKDRLMCFMKDLLAQYDSIMEGEQQVLFKMKDLWNFMAPAFEDRPKELKAIRKAKSYSEYNIAVRKILEGE